jgi:hypothetical protein
MSKIQQSMETASRACEVIKIPSGIRGILPAGAVVRIM